MGFIGARTSILDGLDLGLLQARLQALQLAYLELTGGAKVATASYSQADGARSVSYTQANIADLTAAILTVQSAIDAATGQAINRRMPKRPYFSR